MAANEKNADAKTNIETLLEAVDQQLLVRLLESLVTEQMPPAGLSGEGGSK